MTVTDNPIAAFADAMRAAGIEPPGTIKADGRLHRFRTNGRRGDDSGWLVVHLDGVAAGAFGDWRTGVSETWCARGADTLTPSEREAWRARVERAKKEAEAERAREHAEAAKRARAIWSATQPVSPAHPYLTRKGVTPTATLRELPTDKAKDLLGYAPAVKGEVLAGRILVAPIVINNNISSIEFIGEDGRKAFLKGGAIAGGLWAPGELPEGQGENVTILIGEGVATVLSAAEATGHVGVAALSAGNLPAAAKAVRARLPKARIVLLADLDENGVGIAKATEAALATGGRVALPDFGEARPADADDFNDMAAHRGLGAVRASIAAAKVPEPEGAAPNTNAHPKVETAALDDDAEIARLAKLSSMQYDRERECAAKWLGCRVGTLDAAVKAKRGNGAATGQGRPLELPEPKPWAEPVDVAALLDKIVTVIRRHVVIGEGLAEAAALWIVGAHALAAFIIFARLVLVSPEKQCGKSSLLEIISYLVPRRLFVSNATAASLFRVIEAARPTLLLDEADSFLADNEELRGIVNAGHRRDGAVLRTVGDDHEPRQFSVWAPMAIAAIGRVAGTIEDRSIILQMRRRRPDECIEAFRADRTEALDRLARMAARWAQDHRDALAKADPAVPARIYNRAADNWRPLLAIAEAAGGRWPEFARRIAETMVAAAMGDDASIRVALLADIRAAFEAKGVDRLPSAGLVGELVTIEGRPWGEWKAGRALTTHGLARLLAPFGVRPCTMKIEGCPIKGYRLDQFQDVFARYLAPPSFQTVTSLPGQDFRGFQPDQQPLPGFEGYGSTSPANPQSRAKGYEVTDGNGGRADEGAEDEPEGAEVPASGEALI